MNATFCVHFTASFAHVLTSHWLYQSQSKSKTIVECSAVILDMDNIHTQLRIGHRVTAAQYIHTSAHIRDVQVQVISSLRSYLFCDLSLP